MCPRIFSIAVLVVVVVVVVVVVAVVVVVVVVVVGLVVVIVVAVVAVFFLFFFLFNCLPYLVNKDEYITNLLFQVRGFLAQSERQIITACDHPDDRAQVSQYRQHTDARLVLLTLEH